MIWSEGDVVKAIGGYFELELPIGTGEAPHRQALALNSGRSCLAALLSARGVHTLYLPFYICDSVVDVLYGAGVEARFYPLDEHLEIAASIEPQAGEALLYVNYFGLKQPYAEQLAQRFRDALIIDNSQAFFAPPLEGIDSFYSPRKFFGVADGGYLYSRRVSGEGLTVARSAEHAQHLLGRLDDGPEAWFDAYQQAEAAIARQGVSRISALSQALLAGIDYTAARRRREANYEHLRRELGDVNRLALAADGGAGPMVYPLMVADSGLREALIGQRVYVARYWPEVAQRAGVGEWERQLVDRCIPLPVDQRYDAEDMQRVVQIIREYLNER